MEKLESKLYVVMASVIALTVAALLLPWSRLEYTNNLNETRHANDFYLFGVAGTEYDEEGRVNWTSWGNYFREEVYFFCGTANLLLAGSALFLIGIYTWFDRKGFGPRTAKALCMIGAGLTIAAVELWVIGWHVMMYFNVPVFWGSSQASMGIVDGSRSTVYYQSSPAIGWFLAIGLAVFEYVLIYLTIREFRNEKSAKSDECQPAV